MGRLTHRPDDVVSCPDAIINKARIAIQYHRPDVSQPWSGRTHSRYGNCVLKNCRPDVLPPWSGRAKPYKEITCSGRATVRTSVSNRLDVSLKQERFSAKFSENPVVQLSVRTAQVHRPDGVRTYYSSRQFCIQPINRGPWAFRTARIQY
jgi:hypothetical protein